MTPIRYGIDDLDTIVQDEIKPRLSDKSIVLLNGPLGAGKTTLMRNLLASYGVQGPIVSPTFSYVQTYENNAGEVFHHFDLYRLQNEDSFFALGLDQFLAEKEALSFIEWPEVIFPWLKNTALISEAITLILSYDIDDQAKRSIEIVASEQK